MTRWLRVVIPTWWAVFAGAFYLGLEAIFLGIEWRLGVPFYTCVDDKIFIAVMASCVAAYAAYRVWAFHPALRPRYCGWLSRTPWAGQKPLPLGPVHLVLQDMLLLSAAVGLCWQRVGIEALAVLKAFLTCYLTILSFTLVCTGQKAWAYSFAFGLGFMGLFALSPKVYVVAGAAYVAALLGLRASLTHVPWHDVPQLQRLQWFMTNLRSRCYEMLGWPFSRLGPGLSKEFQFKLGDLFLTGPLAGRAVFVTAYHRFADDARLPLLLMWAALWRIFRYCHGYAPPLSLLGRLAHGRLIIPGYDRVFMAPLLTVLVFVAAITMPHWNDVPELIAVPVGVMASWWILFGMRPSLDAWRFTGNHQIVKGSLMTAGQQNR